MPGVPPPRTFEPPQGHLNSTVYEQNTNAWRCPTPWDNAVVARPGSSVVPKKIFTCARWNRSIWKSQKSQDKVKINGWFFCIISTVEYVSKSLSCFFLYMLCSKIQTNCWTHWSFLWSIWKLQVAIPCVGIVPTPCCLTLINWLIDSLIQLRPIHHYLARSRKPFWCHSAHLLIFPFFPLFSNSFCIDLPQHGAGLASGERLLAVRCHQLLEGSEPESESATPFGSQHSDINTEVTPFWVEKNDLKMLLVLLASCQRCREPLKRMKLFLRSHSLRTAHSHRIWTLAKNSKEQSVKVSEARWSLRPRIYVDQQGSQNCLTVFVCLIHLFLHAWRSFMQQETQLQRMCKKHELVLLFITTRAYRYMYPDMQGTVA